MGNQESRESHIRRVYRSTGYKGIKEYGSFKVTLPIEWTRERGIKEGSHVKMIPQDDGSLSIYKLE